MSFALLAVFIHYYFEKLPLQVQVNFKTYFVVHHQKGLGTATPYCSLLIEFPFIFIKVPFLIINLFFSLWLCSVVFDTSYSFHFNLFLISHSFFPKLLIQIPRSTNQWSGEGWKVCSLPCTSMLTLSQCSSNLEVYMDVAQTDIALTPTNSDHPLLWSNTVKKVQQFISCIIILCLLYSWL